MNSMKTYLVMAVVALGAVGCGTTTDAGSKCMVNADCDPGLSCIPDDFPNADGFCAAAGTRQCTKQCQTDAECTKTAPYCRQQCSGKKACSVLKPS